MKCSPSLCCTSALAVMVSFAAQAQSWPTKPIRVIVPVSAGGGIDTVARAMAQKYSEAWKQPVVVENRAGAGGTIGAEVVARAPKDGHTLLINSTSQASSAAQYQKLPYDPIKDFAPASQIIFTYLMLGVNASLPVNTVAELVALARAQPGKLNFGSTGSGGSPHMVSELFRLETGINVVHVPYKGDAPLQPALIANEVQYAFLTPIALMNHVKSGKVRALGVTGSRRASIAPDVPTMGESGYPGVELTGWIGVFAPGGTPREILVRIAEETQRALKLPDIAPRVPSWGGDPAGTSPDEFEKRYHADIAKYKRIVKEAGIPPLD
ncbi:MAG: Bug family tripartite tricarboxylate transporter substrate binding protein [Burkholderiales bacterium]